MAKVTSAMIQKMRLDKDPVTMLTCTDASFAGMLDQAEVDMFLIASTSGMVIQAEKTTLAETMADM